MKMNSLAIHDVVEILPPVHGDKRGFFSETYRHDWFSENVAKVEFVQDNQSMTASRGVVRGLHFQAQPYGQGKLVRCVSGAIFDVAVDIRIGSPTFGKWVSAILNGEQGNQLWIPNGFLHGFCTLTPNALVCYKVTNPYDARADKGVRWNDPDIGIAWPEFVDENTLSAKDAGQPFLKDIHPDVNYSPEEN